MMIAFLKVKLEAWLTGAIGMILALIQGILPWRSKEFIRCLAYLQMFQPVFEYLLIQRLCHDSKEDRENNRFSAVNYQ